MEIVDVLETIQIDGDHRKPVRAATDSFEVFLDPFFQEGPVRHAGHRIVQCQVPIGGRCLLHAPLVDKESRTDDHDNDHGHTDDGRKHDIVRDGLRRHVYATERHDGHCRHAGEMQGNDTKHHHRRRGP